LSSGQLLVRCSRLVRPGRPSGSTWEALRQHFRGTQSSRRVGVGLFGRGLSAGRVCRAYWAQRKAPCRAPGPGKQPVSCLHGVCLAHRANALCCLPPVRALSLFLFPRALILGEFNPPSRYGAQSWRGRHCRRSAGTQTVDACMRGRCTAGCLSSLSDRAGFFFCSLSPLVLKARHLSEGHVRCCRCL
jgi:hypothetical protein